MTYVPEGCGVGQTFSGCDNIVDDNSTITDSSLPGIVHWDPYFISVNERCSTFSVRTDEMEGRVRRLLNNMQETILGAELWDGAQAQASGNSNMWLANNTSPNFVDLSGGTGVGYVRALACLEEYLADNNGGQQGVIHATTQVVTHWESFRLLRREGNNILTFQDTLVIPSPGYSGNDPSGTTGAGNVWAYATDVPRIFLGNVEVYVRPLQSVDRYQNTVSVIAQRPALVEWQLCRHAGIQLDITPCGAY